jgi:ADP-dependent NAD(P)H-hydrate dehydratase / NAD(P)H-hydrate epimerase
LINYASREGLKIVRGEMIGLELLTADEMVRADAAALAQGVSEHALMEAAGLAVAQQAMAMVGPEARVVVLCGPGNNGGDGYVAARVLAENGYVVQVAANAIPKGAKGVAVDMARAWMGEVLPLKSQSVGEAGLVIDALFGAGLTRPVAPELARMLMTISRSSTPILAVDLPTGLDAGTGEVLGGCYQATHTVTFVRRKPAHVLLPGRDLCGAVSVFDIGVNAEAVREVSCETWLNGPEVWMDRFPKPGSHSHKFTRGHAIVVSGPPQSTGAARLGARGALRIGAGAVTLATTVDAFMINAVNSTAVMVKPYADPASLGSMVARLHTEHDAVLVGPGLRRSDVSKETVLAVLRNAPKVVLDADALTTFSDDEGPEDGGRAELFAAIAASKGQVILTPHEGEFKRLFPAITGSKLDRARAAAAKSKAIVVLKGADTVIAAPDQRAVINDNAPAWLATAGSGDVLAGFIAGLLAQGMPAFEAACAAVWIHGAVATDFGPGLIAEDLPERLPYLLAELASL